MRNILFKNKKIFFHFVGICNEQYRFGHDIELYREIIRTHREVNNLEEILKHKRFFSLIMETLEAWNMNQRGARLTTTEKFMESVEPLKNQLTKLYEFKLYSARKETISKPILLLLNDIFCKLQVMESSRRIVGVSKALHFMLPDLVLPIDSNYTLNFFYGYNKYAKDAQKEFKIFSDIFEKSHDITRGLCLGQEDADGDKWNTSVPKLVDNAIIGFFKYLEKHSAEEVKGLISSLD